MAADVIGKVAVKVIPDTKDFRPDLKKSLEKIENGLKIKVRATFDDAGLKAEVLKSVRALNLELKTKDAYKVKFRAAISEMGMRGEIKKALRELNALAKTQDSKVKFQGTVSTASVEVELDKESLRNVERALNKWRDKISPLVVGVRAEMLLGASAPAAARLAYLTRPRIVSIIPVVNTAALAAAAGAIGTFMAALSGGRLVHNTLDGIWSRIKNLDKAVPIIGGLSTAFAGLSAATLTSAANVFSLASSLATIAPAALALPGIFGGLAIGLGASFAVLKDFNKVIPEFKKSLEVLQNKMSTKFWSVAEAPMRNMIKVLFPIFSKSIQKTATELGGFFGSLATSMKGSLGPVLSTMFDDLNASIKISSGYTDSFAGIIATLGTVGAGYLPKLARWFGEIAESFDGWLSKAQADGRLNAWIDRGLEALSELGRAIGNLGGIFMGLADIADASGGSTVTTLADMLQRVETVIKGKTFKSEMVAVLIAARLAMEDISNRVGPSFEAFMLALSGVAQRVFPLLGSIIGTAFNAIFSALAQPEVANGVVAMFTGIQKAVMGLAPAMGPVGIALGGLMKIVGALAGVMGPILGVALATVARLFTSLVPVLMPLINLLGGALLGAIKIVAPLILQLGAAIAQAFVTTLLPALKVLMPVILNLLAQILPPLVAFFTGVLLPAIMSLVPVITNVAKTILPMLADFFTERLLPVLAIIVPIIAKLAAEIFPLVGKAIAEIIKVLGPLVTKIGELIAFIAPFLIPVLKFLAGVILDTVVLAVKGLVNVVTGVIDVFMGVINFVKNIFAGNWSEAWQNIKDIAAGIWKIIKGAFQLFFSVGIGKVLGLGMKALKGIWGKAWGAIKDVAGVIWSSIKGRFWKLLADLKSAPGQALAAIVRFFKGAWDDIKAGVQLLWEVLPKWFSKGTSKVIGFVKAIPGKIWEGFKNIGSLLTNAGGKLLEGFVKGITKGFTAVKNKLGELTGKLTSWKGPPSTDATILIGAGQMVIAGFLVGIESQYDSVRKSLTGFTHELSDMKADPLGLADVSDLSAKVSTAVTGGLASDGPQVIKEFNYYAAPGNSLGAEEDLFKATERERMVGW